MPMTFTDAVVQDHAKHYDLTGTADEMREQLSRKMDAVGEHLGAWEVRTGRPWNEMTPDEATALALAHPVLARNPGCISRMMAREEEA